MSEVTLYECITGLRLSVQMPKKIKYTKAEDAVLIKFVSDKQSCTTGHPKP